MLSLPARALYILLLAMLAATPARANPIDSHELDIIDLIANGPGSGYMTARTCDECPVQRLRLSPETRLFLQGRALAPGEGWRLRNRSGVVRVNRSTGLIIDVRVRH